MPCIGSRKAEPRLEIFNRNLRRWTDDDLILCILTAGGQRHDDVDVYLHGGTDPVSVAQTRFRLFNVRGVAQYVKWLRAVIKWNAQSATWPIGQGPVRVE